MIDEIDAEEQRTTKMTRSMTMTLTTMTTTMTTSMTTMMNIVQCKVYEDGLSSIADRTGH